jgi:3-oxoacyl-(acyl-carrier-protein) synthase
MGVNTPLGDQLDIFLENLYQGNSAITNWKFVKNSKVYSKVGGDLSDYDALGKAATLEAALPLDVFIRQTKLLKKAPFSTRLTVLSSINAWLDAGLTFDLNPYRQAIIVAGHNLAERFLLKNHTTFLDEPDWIDGITAVVDLDSDHAASVGEVIGSKGALYTMGAACASGNVALRNAIDEIRHHDHDIVVVTGAPFDFSEMGLHAMAIIGAITIESFNDVPEQASRPYDVKREGFVPSHGAATLIVERLDHALARGARIYAEVLGAVATSDSNHLPSPSTDGQEYTIKKVLHEANITPEQVDFVCAHATSTPMGDISEINALKRVFGDHAYKLKINAPKSMLGHTCWSAPVVESVAAILQMQNNRLHPSINIDELDPDIDLDVCANEAVDHEISVILKNSFGFGGINCCSIFQKFRNQ